MSIACAGSQGQGEPLQTVQGVHAVIFLGTGNAGAGGKRAALIRFEHSALGVAVILRAQKAPPVRRKYDTIAFDGLGGIPGPGHMEGIDRLVVWICPVGQGDGQAGVVKGLIGKGCHFSAVDGDTLRRSIGIRVFRCGNIFVAVIERGGLECEGAGAVAPDGKAVFQLCGRKGGAGCP